MKILGCPHLWIHLWIIVVDNSERDFAISFNGLGVLNSEVRLGIHSNLI